MRVLAIDLGTENTGWAIGDNDERPEHGTYHPPRTGRDLAHLLVDLRLHFRPMIATVGFVVYEAPVFVAANNVLTVRKMMAMGGQLEVVTHDVALEEGRRIGCEEELPGRVRKHFLGLVPRHRAQIKAAVMARCALLGWKPANDDEGDSLALWHYTICMKHSRVPSAAFKSGALL